MLLFNEEVVAALKLFSQQQHPILTKPMLMHLYLSI